MSGGAAASTVPKLVDYPEAAPAVEPWPVREKKVCMCHRALLAAGSLMTLLLLACFDLGRDSASSVAWLQIDVAKLTGMNNGTAGKYGRPSYACEHCCISTKLSYVTCLQGLRRTLLMVVTTSSAGFCRRAWTGGRAGFGTSRGCTTSLQVLPVRGVAVPPAQAARLRSSAPAVRPRHAALRQVLGAAPVRPQCRRHGVHLRRVAPLRRPRQPHAVHGERLPLRARCSPTASSSPPCRRTRLTSSASRSRARRGGSRWTTTSPSKTWSHRGSTSTSRTRGSSTPRWSARTRTRRRACRRTCT